MRLSTIKVTSCFRLKIWSVFGLSLITALGFAQQPNNIIPKPQKIEVLSGEFRLVGTLDSILDFTSDSENLSSNSIPTQITSGITIEFQSSLDEIPLNPEEGYSIEINSSGISIKTFSPKGAFYALQTLKQLAKKDGNDYVFPYCRISDWPAFRIRGFMHDVGRSFIPVDLLMEQIEILSSYKINVFHWHLTEDLAWRLELEIFPELTAPKNMKRFPGLYYSKKDVRKLLAFAKKHHVTVIPEIDMPGHSAAFERAMGYDMQSPQGIIALKLILKETRELFIDSPYIHLGTDEVQFTNPEFVPEMVAFARRLGFKVISWNPGWDYQEGEIDMLHLWSYRGKKNGTIPVIDSRFHYINHFDPFADLISLYRSNVLGQKQGDEVVAGSILAIWNDRKLKTPESILLENNFYPLMLTFSERLWRGGGDGYFDEVGVIYPLKGTSSLTDWEEFESRLLFHKESYFKDQPFPYFRQSDHHWKVTLPQSNQGNLDSVFTIEKILLGKNPANFDSIPTVDATGGTIYLRHVWGPLVPAYFEDPKPYSTAYAYTWIYSPVDQKVQAWISFQDYSRSEKDLAPPLGQWDWKGSKIWINQAEFLPPTWINNHQLKSNEVSLQNENVQSRPPSSFMLHTGWNQILLKLPVGEFSTAQLRLVKWMFTFAILDGDGLVFSGPPNFSSLLFENNNSKLEPIKIRDIIHPGLNPTY